MKEFIYFIGVVLSTIFIILTAYVIIDKVFNEPIVYYSHSLGECVKIETSEGFLPCSRIKDFKSYSFYWVK